MSGPHPPNGFRPPPPPGHQGPPPGHHGPPGHPQGPPQQQKPPPMFNSTKVSDLRPSLSIPPLDEAAYKKKLTMYHAYSVRKAPPLSAREDPTWARATIEEERLEQSEILKEIKRLNKHNKRSVAEKKAALAPFQNQQVTKILDDLKSNERDAHLFGYSLAQIGLEQRRRPSKDSKKKSFSRTSTKVETTLMMIYVQRVPLSHVNCRQLYEFMHRPPPPPQHHQPPPPPLPLPPPPHQGPPPPLPGPPGPPNNRPGAPPPILGQNRAKSPDRRKSPGRRKTRRSSSSSSASSSSSRSRSSYDSDSDSNSRTDSSSMTSISSRSKHGRDHRRSHSRRPRNRNRSVSRNRNRSASRNRNRSASRVRDCSRSRLGKDAPRHHQKEYYTGAHRGMSPEPWIQNVNALAPRPMRTISNVPVATAIDPFEAYRRGLLDAKAHLAEHHSPRVPHRPVVIQDPPGTALTYRPRRNTFVEPHHPEPRLPRQYALEPSYEAHAPRPRDERYYDQPRALVPDVRDHRYPEYHRGPPRIEQFVHDFQDFQSEGTMPRTPSPPIRDFDLRRQERDIEDYQRRVHRGDGRISSTRSFSINPFTPRSPPPLRRQYSPSNFSASSRGW